MQKQSYYIKKKVQQPKIILTPLPISPLNLSSFTQAMGFASTIPLRFEAGVCRARIPSPESISLSSSNRRCNVSCFTSQSQGAFRNCNFQLNFCCYLLNSEHLGTWVSVGRHCHGLRLSRMQCSRCTEKDDSLSTGEIISIFLLSWTNTVTLLIIGICNKTRERGNETHENSL